MRNKCLWLAISIVIASCKKNNDDTSPNPPPPPPVTVADNDPLLPGNPTLALTDGSYTTNYLKDNSYYKIAYHRNRGIPV